MPTSPIWRLGSRPSRCERKSRSDASRLGAGCELIGRQRVAAQLADLDLAERLREEQGASLEAPFPVERVRFLAVEGAVELELATSDRDSELLDPLHQQGGDASAAVVVVDDQLVHVADRALMAQAALHRERSQADDPRIELGADVPLARRREPSLEHAAEGRFAKHLLWPVLAQQLEDGAKIL